MRDLRSALLRAFSLPQQACCGGLATKKPSEASQHQNPITCLNCNGEQMVCRRCESLFCRWCDFEGLEFTKKYGGMVCSGCEVLCREERRAAKGGSKYVDEYVPVSQELLREGPSPLEAKISKARKAYEQKRRSARVGNSLRRTGSSKNRDEEQPPPPLRRKSVLPQARALDEAEEGMGTKNTRREETEAIRRLGSRIDSKHKGRPLIDSPKTRSSESLSNMSSNMSMENTPKVCGDASRADGSESSVHRSQRGHGQWHQ